MLKRTVNLDYRFKIVEIPSGAGKIAAWVPIPLSNANQKLIHFDIKSEWEHKILAEQEYGNRILYFDMEGNTDNRDIKISIEFRIKRNAWQKLNKQQKINPVSRVSLTRFLSPDSLVPVNGKIAEEAHNVAGNTKEPLAAAKRLYEHIIKTIGYDKTGIGWGRGDAVYACDIRKGNCTDFHSLFIGQARALGIPARFIMGVPLPSAKTIGKISGYHCWAEFYLEDRGWIPIDASEAHKNPERKAELFGGLDPNRIQFTIGRDIRLPFSKSGKLNYFIYPHVEVDGKIHSKVETEFSFRDIS